MQSTEATTPLLVDIHFKINSPRIEDAHFETLYASDPEQHHRIIYPSLPSQDLAPGAIEHIPLWFNGTW